MNNQPITKKSEIDGYKVVEVFDSLQGEGRFIGTPATFIRFAGCNLNCQFCDTDYTNNATDATLEQLLKMVSRELVVLTGGEPMLYDLKPLCDELVSIGHKVQIETNGTINIVGLPGEVHITCSPKTQKINVKPDDIKFLCGEGAPFVSAGSDLDVPKYIMALDGTDKTEAYLIAMDNDFIYTSRLHKELGIR